MPLRRASHRLNSRALTRPIWHLSALSSRGAIGIFYTIAGQSLQAFRPLSGYHLQHQLETVFTVTNRFLLAEWNASPSFRQAVHPQELLAAWLGFRIEPGGHIEALSDRRATLDPIHRAS